MINYYFAKIAENAIFLKGKLIINKIYNSTQSGSVIPFFIISPGRSGSTLLRKLLMMDGQINIPPESYDCIPQSIKYYITHSSNNWRKMIDGVCEIFLKDPGFSYWNLDLEKHATELFNIKEEEKTLFTIIDFIYRLHTRIKKPTATYYGDKTPFLSLKLRWIDFLFPGAKYIFLYRDPVDVVYSRMENFNESFEQSLKRVFWSYREMKKFEKKSSENKIFRINYEEFITESDQKLSEIYTFLGIHGKEKKEPATKMVLGDDTLQHHKNLKEPVSSKYIGRGYKQLKPSQINSILRKTYKFI
jgi:hypothetical protein